MNVVSKGVGTDAALEVLSRLDAILSQRPITKEQEKETTYNLGNSLGPALSILLTTLGTSAGEAGNTKDSGHLHLVKVRH